MTRLSKKQQKVLDDLFAGDDEQAVLARHKVSRNVYNKWQKGKNFAAEFQRRLAALNRQSKLIIAKYAALAAAKLVELTDSANQETARKACLDIISLPKKAGEKTQLPERGGDNDSEQAFELSAKKTGRLLAALAEPEQAADSD